MSDDGKCYNGMVVCTDADLSISAQNGNDMVTH